MAFGLASACTLNHAVLNIGGDVAPPFDATLDGDARPDVALDADVATCTVDTRTDVFNCGACGHVCPHGAHQEAVCVASVCTTECDANFAHCMGEASAGCESSLLDPAHCGVCGTLCPSGNLCATTDGGATCVSACTPPDMQCSGTCVDVHTSTTNCGACGTVCGPYPSATPICNDGVCAPVCSAGYADCNGMAADGCESQPASDVNNCGACRSVCPTTMHGTTMCSAGVCHNVCEPGYGLMGTQCVTCGDRVIESGESCDDGNVAAGDGCDATCQVESVGSGTCPGAFALAITRGVEIYTGTTTGRAMSNYCDSPMRGVTSPDVAYRFAPMVSGNLTISLTTSSPTTYQPLLIVRSACDTLVMSQITCSESVPDAGTAGTSITVTAGTTYYAIVDGVLGSSGPYTLTFSLP